MKETVDIIDDEIAKINKTINIISQETNDGIIELTVDCTFWLHTNFILTIDGEIYTIDSFLKDSQLNLIPKTQGQTIDVDSFEVPKPFYVHGTHKDIKNQLSEIHDKTTLIPLIWFKEIYRDRKSNDDLSAIDREVDIMLWFLTSVPTEDILTDKHYTDAIYPMQSLVDCFIKQLDSSRFFIDDVAHEDVNLINASLDGSQENSIFDFNLSGKSVRLFAEIRKDLSCTNKKVN